MNMWGWIVLLVIVFVTISRFINKEKRTKKEIVKASFIIAIVIAIIVAVLVFSVPYMIALLCGFIVMIVLNKKTYTKKWLLIYSSCLVVIAGLIGGVYIAFFKENPDRVLDYLKEHPQSTSLFLAVNQDEFISYNADQVLPLASTVKILIAIEYAMQVAERKIDQEQRVPLEDLTRFFYKNTDGGAHEAWLKMLEEEKKIVNGTVSLHEAAKGMITYSSNANTDYFIDLLTSDAINARAQALNLSTHEAIYPIVGAMLIPTVLKNDYEDEEQLIEALKSMSPEQYREQAFINSNKVKSGELRLEDVAFDLSLDVQKVWSDRLIGASAQDYGKLLAVISNDELPTAASNILRDVLEWPMQLNPINKETFRHFGAKGGSTAFILNNARYVEDNNGNKMELVLLLDQLKVFDQLLLGQHRNAFESKMIRDEKYREKVKAELESVK